MIRTFDDYVSQFAGLVKEGQKLALGGFAQLRYPAPAANAPKALFFAPHPDDECIVGGIAVRIMRETGMNVINVAVTQGSNKARRVERLEELKNACDYIGFGLV